MKFPIKFRGVSMGGHYVYGLLTMKKIRNSGKLSYAIAKGNFTQGEIIPVCEKNVAQFVGYDKNGKEIYSDDKIRVYDHSRYCMAGTGIEIAGDFIKVNDIGKMFDNVELLEEIGENEKSTSD